MLEQAEETTGTRAQMTRVKTLLPVPLSPTTRGCLLTQFLRFRGRLLSWLNGHFHSCVFLAVTHVHLLNLDTQMLSQAKSTCYLQRNLLKPDGQSIFEC